MESSVERALRDHIMEWVRQRADKNGGFLYRDELLGFQLNGERMPIIDITRGIRNPRIFASTLSIVASADGPYDDMDSGDGFLHHVLEPGDPIGGASRKRQIANRHIPPLLLFRKEIRN